MTGHGNPDDAENMRAERAARIHEQIEKLASPEDEETEPSSPADATERAAREAARRAAREKQAQSEDDWQPEEPLED